MSVQLVDENMLNEQQKTVLNKVCAQDGLKNFSVFVEEGSKKGDNYLGNICLITVKENGKNEEKSYVLKCAENNLNVRLQIPIHNVYEREIFVYETLLSKFESFQQNVGIKHAFKSYTKLRGCSTDDGNEFLLMNNIKSDKFQMLDRKNTMNGEHVSFVFKELAKFHSVSLAMKHMLPDTYQSLASNLRDIFREMGTFQESYERTVPKVLDHALIIMSGHEKATEALKRCQSKISNIFSATNNENYHLVIIHGDPWCNNMMFKYEDQDRPFTPTSMCFLDWQICKLQSPAMDLFYFLFLSGSKFELDNHQQYLNHYYETIQENLQHLGLDTSQLFPYKLFQEHCKQYARVCMCTAMFALQVALTDEKDATNFAELAKDGNIVDEFMLRDNYSTLYNSRMRDIICMMVEHNYL